MNTTDLAGQATPPAQHDVLAWIDVETTGLVASRDYLLEVACIVTDTQLRPLAEPFHRVVQYDEAYVSIVKATANDFVREMHEKTGLWDRLTSGTDQGLVDEQLLEYIRAVAPEKRQARVAGNSVRLDLNFLEEWLPDTYDHLHYRFVDVTGFEYLLTQWGVAEALELDKDHTALGDITSSITQLHFLMGQLHDTKSALEMSW